MSSTRYDNFTEEDCIKWKKDRTKNPQTGRQLKESSIIIKKLKKICNENNTKKLKNSPKRSPRTNNEIQIEIQKYKKILADEILTNEEIDELNEKIKILEKKKRNHINNEPLTKDECNKWFKDKLRNPRTNILIEKDKKLYNEIDKQCEKFKEKKISILTKALTEDECKMWFENDKINPRTNLELKETDKSYGIIKKQCDIYKEKNKEPIKFEEKKKEYIFKDNNIDNIYYPDLDDSKFREKINSLYEYLVHKIKKNKIVNDTNEFDMNTKKLCSEFEKTYYQHFISHYISSRTPYKSLMLYHGVGVGKTCSAITLSENLLLTHSQNEEPKIWVIMPSALRGSFREQVFSLSNFDNYKALINQCTGDTYVKMTQILKSKDKEKAQLKLKKFIKSP